MSAPKLKHLRIGISLVSLLGIVSCGNNTPDHPDGGIKQGTKSIETSIDATNENEFVFYQLSELIKSADNKYTVMGDKRTDAGWDIAFRRYGIIINDGVMGPSSVRITLQAPQTDFYNANNEPLIAKFESATPNSELHHFTDASTEGIAFYPSEKSLAIAYNSTRASWYSYDSLTQKTTLYPNRYFLIRGSNSFAPPSMSVPSLEHEFGRLRIISSTGTGGLSSQTYTFGVAAHLRYTEASWKAESTIAITFTETLQCYDFSNADSQALTDCRLIDWDIAFIQEGNLPFIYLNSDIIGSGSGSGVRLAKAWIRTFSTGTINVSKLTPQLYKSDFSDNALTSTANDLSEYSWYTYRLSTHKIYPNYRVYLLKKGEDIYKMRIISYYNYSSGVSGYPRIHLEKIN